MSKRKGLSLEDKRVRMLEIFYEKKDVFQLKDLEKLGPKEKGIVSQSVKEVVQGLVDDGYVDSDKIGTSIYFWAFPSKATALRERKLVNLDETIRDQKIKSEELDKEFEVAMAGREDTPERREVLEKLDKVLAAQKVVQVEIDKYRDSDPEVFAKEKKEMQILEEGAERWKDNVLSIRSWIKNKLNVEESMINKQFNIPEDFEDS